MRWLRDTAPTIGVVFGPDGNAADVGDVEVTITRGDGVTKIADAAAATNGGSGVYTYDIPATETTDLDYLTAVWTATTPGESLTTYEEIVGSLIFSETDARSFDDGELGSATDAQIVVARDRITDTIEMYTGIAFGARYARRKWQHPMRTNHHRLDLNRGRHLVGGNGGSGYRPLTVISATDTGTALTPTDIETHPLGYLDRTVGTWSTASAATPWPIEVEYEYGYERIPGDIIDAALRLARYELVVSDVTDRMISFSDPNVGSVRLSIPSFRYPTGIPLVDAVLNRYRLPGAFA
jgi:hypothetical protein